jgi:hypothetical protein
VYIIINNTSDKSTATITQLSIHKIFSEGPIIWSEGETKEIIAAREKVHLTAAKWETIKAAINHGEVILLNSTREVLMEYKYALHQQKKHLL